MLILSFSVDLVETLVDFGADSLGFCDRVSSLFAHDTRYFLQEQFILAFYLYLAHLFDHLSLAVVDDYCLRVLHKFGIYRFHLFQIG